MTQLELFESENWRPVVGYEGLYEVSDLGRVRSLRTGQVMVLVKGGRYLVVKLSRDGRYVTRRVHRIVGDAWLGPRPHGWQTRHGPAGALDNSVTNLSYGTSFQNHMDMRRDGTIICGNDHHSSKLTDADVANCRARHASGETIIALAAEYGIHRNTMGEAIRRQTWRHVALPRTLLVDPRRT